MSLRKRALLVAIIPFIISSCVCLPPTPTNDNPILLNCDAIINKSGGLNLAYRIQTSAKHLWIRQVEHRTMEPADRIDDTLKLTHLIPYCVYSSVDGFELNLAEKNLAMPIYGTAASYIKQADSKGRLMNGNNINGRLTVINASNWIELRKQFPTDEEKHSSQAPKLVILVRLHYADPYAGEVAEYPLWNSSDYKIEVDLTTNNVLTRPIYDKSRIQNW